MAWRKGPDRVSGACLGMVGTETQLARHGHVQQVDRRIPSPRADSAWRLVLAGDFGKTSATFFKENYECVKQKLQRAKVDEDWMCASDEWRGHLSVAQEDSWPAPVSAHFGASAVPKRAGRRLLRNGQRTGVVEVPTELYRSPTRQLTMTSRHSCRW